MGTDWERRMVRAATSRVGKDWSPTFEVCPRKTDDRRCSSVLQVRHSKDAVRWSCTGCLAEGEIRGFEQTRDDLRAWASKRKRPRPAQAASLAFPPAVFHQLAKASLKGLPGTEFLWTSKIESGEVQLKTSREECEVLLVALQAAHPAQASAQAKARFAKAIKIVQDRLRDPLEAILEQALQRFDKTSPDLETRLRAMGFAPREADKFLQMYQVLVDLLGPSLGQAAIVERVMSIARGYRLSQRFGELLTSAPRDWREWNLVQTPLEHLMTDTRDLATIDRGTAFTVFRHGLTLFQAIADEVPGDENEVAEWAEEFATEALKCLSQGPANIADRKALVQQCWTAWKEERNENFDWVPGWTAGLTLDKRERTWLKGWLEPFRKLRRWDSQCDALLAK